MPYPKSKPTILIRHVSDIRHEKDKLYSTEKWIKNLPFRSYTGLPIKFCKLWTDRLGFTTFAFNSMKQCQQPFIILQMANTKQLIIFFQLKDGRDGGR